MIHDVNQSSIIGVKKDPAVGHKRSPDAQSDNNQDEF